MSDQTLLYWGMVVTMFLLIAAMITARELFEIYLEKRAEQSDEASPGNTQPADANRSQ